MSLRVRLLLMTLLVLSIVVGAVAFLSGRATVEHFQHYVESDIAGRFDRSQSIVLSYYARTGSWAGIDSVLQSISRLNGQPLLLVGKDGAPVAASSGDLKNSQISIGTDRSVRIETIDSQDGVSQRRLMIVKGPHMVLRDGKGMPVGTLFLVPRDPELPQAMFIGGVNRSLLWAVILASVVGIGLTLLVSQRILSPIRELTAATRRMQAGDFSQRVRVASKDEIGALGRAFNEMADDIVRIEGLRRQMVSDVAHELRTPLTNIRCQLEAIQDGIVAATPSTIDSLHDESMLLSRLIEDLQDLALAEAGQLSLRPEPVSVADLIERAVSACEPRAAAAGVRLKTSIPSDLPGISADPRRLGQILRNLLDNSLTHTAAGGTVETGAVARNGSVHIHVRDTGAGIPAEHLPNVFERFYRADESRSRGTGGFGLGLSIVRQIVEAHGGTIAIESRVNEGTTVTFTLPMAGPGPFTASS